MSGYADGEALLQTVIQGASGFSASNVTRKDWGALNTGSDKYYAVLRRGPGENTGENYGGNNTMRYVTVVELWHHFQSYPDDATSLDDVEKTLTDRIRKYRLLGDTADTIRDADVIRIDEPVEITLRGETSPRYLRLDIYVQWEEETTISYAE